MRCIRVLESKLVSRWVEFFYYFTSFLYRILIPHNPAMSLLIGSTVCLSVMPESEHRPLVPRMSAPGLTSEAQLRYILQWFGEFSELQREDFMPVLAAARSGTPDQLAATLASLSCEDKPVSLFQCRIKLFNEWFPSWTEEEQDRLIKGVSEVDSEFGTKLQDIMTDGPQLNGELNGTIDETPVKAENGEQWEQNHDSAVAESNVIPQDNMPVEIAAAS